MTFLTTVLVGSTGIARAGGPTPADARQLRIERSLACPQCTDLPLDVCDRDICDDMRAVIQQKVAAGESDQAIRQYFVQRYGTRVLLAPPSNGSNVIAWMMPFAGLAFGGLAVYTVMRGARRSRHRTHPFVAVTTSTSGYRLRAEREAEQFE
ncbi:MAG: cytochrome c-type biogenesis protein [Dehalococcoidia bacterium]